MNPIVEKVYQIGHLPAGKKILCFFLCFCR